MPILRGNVADVEAADIVLLSVTFVAIGVMAIYILLKLFAGQR